MANRSVVLYHTHKNQEKVDLRKAPEELTQLACGEYYLSWYIKKRKHLESAGNNPEAVLQALQKKRLEMAYVAAGGAIQQPDQEDPRGCVLEAGGKIWHAENETLKASPLRRPGSSSRVTTRQQRQRKLVRKQSRSI